MTSGNTTKSIDNEEQPKSFLVQIFIYNIRNKDVFAMKIETEQNLISLSNEQLKSLYHKINSQLTKNLLSGAGIETEKQRIQMLNRISEELNRRNFATKMV